VIIIAKEPDLSGKELCISTKEPCISEKEPCFCAKEPFVSVAGRCLSAKEYCISTERTLKMMRINCKHIYIYKLQQTYIYIKCSTYIYTYIHINCSTCIYISPQKDYNQGDENKLQAHMYI